MSYLSKKKKPILKICNKKGKCKHQRGMRIKVHPVDDAADIPCTNCVNFGWSMPQCEECNKENDYKWFISKIG